MELKEALEEFNGEELNELKNELQKENLLDEEEALIEENEQDSDDEDSNNDKRFPVEEPTDWIHWFCKLRGNEFFCEIDDNFIKNEENLVGINCDKFIKILLGEKPSLKPTGKRNCLLHKILGQKPNIPLINFSLINPNPIGVLINLL